ncbi:hypothetical protein [Francisella marina]|uniref:hypothetical protein n=1 Tax=Francisella marina TaxID=2249302 RepID=UPI0011EDB29B|nr:hypothetical protein [Francisella marina]QEO58325.1 hypothetical protein F0R75_00510 [Francisella marina]
MSKIFNLKVDKEQTKGRWFDFYIDDAYMGQVKISCAKKNKEFAKKVVDINTHYSKEIKSGKNEEQVLQALYFAYANSIVLGVKDTKGKEYQLSNEDIVEMFKDEDTGTELFNFVQDKCSKITNFLEEKKEEIVKK